VLSPGSCSDAGAAGHLKRAVRGTETEGMRNVLLVIGLVGLFVWRGGFLAGEVDASALRAEGPDPCARAERCLGVYLAPWCPQCQKSHELVAELRARAVRSGGRVGVKVIVGRDERAALERYAEQLGPPVFFDDDGAFLRQLGGGGVPTWVSWDASGRVLERFSGRPTGAPTPVLADHVSEILGLSDLL
jgi:YD repeat-containing protein